MPEAVLLVDEREGIAALTPNRPDQMNALSLAAWAGSGATRELAL